MDAASIGAEVEALKRQIRSLREQVSRHDEWLDTISAPPWKRLWWVACGWRWSRPGRWYGADALPPEGETHGNR